jgi:hypothetical protein
MDERVLNEAFVRRYRELLDAEDSAFDELEHAWEEGDRANYEADFATWQNALSAKMQFLGRKGLLAKS